MPSFFAAIIGQIAKSDARKGEKSQRQATLKTKGV